MRYRINYQPDPHSPLRVARNGASGYHDLALPYSTTTEIEQSICQLLAAQIPPDIQAQLVNLIAEERATITRRQQFLANFREQFHPIAVEFTSNLPTTHPEIFI